LNWYRQSELDGALLLGRLVRRASDPDLVAQLTKHCADEARHAWQWARTIEGLRLPTVRIRRSYQSFYLDEISTPRTITEVLALTHVFEHRVHRHFSDELNQAGLPAAVRRTFNALLRDEQGHLDWIAVWLSVRPEADAILQRYRQADERIVHRLMPYADRLWQVHGLGEELSEGIEYEHGTAQEERNQAQSQYSA
jgi:hypothetical protein